MLVHACRSIKLKTLKAGGTLSKAHSVCVPNKLAKLRAFPLLKEETGVVIYSRPTRDGKKKKERVRPRIIHAMWSALSDGSFEADGKTQRGCKPCARARSLLNHALLPRLST